MFDINTKVQWRTGGRGVFRVLKGTVISIVKAGKLPIKSMQDKVPHGDKPSNRDRYICEIKDGVFAWANIKTCWKQGEKMPKHTPRLQTGKVKKVTKGKRKLIAKGKAKRGTKARKLTGVEKKFIVVDKPIKPLDRTPVAKKSGGDKPKTTWYGIVDGKIVSVRKVVCPEGYTKDKPVLGTASTGASPAPTEPPAAPPATGASPSTPALPQSA